MKIVHCLFTMEAAGAQILTVELLNEMCLQNEVELVIVNSWNADLLKQLNPSIKVHCINRKAGDRSIKPIIKLNLLLVRINADIIHCHEPDIIKIILLKRNAKLVHTIHDVGIPTTFYSKYDSLVAISDAVYKDVILKCTLPVTLIYNGIPIMAFKRRINYRGLKPNTIKLVQVSRLLHEKKGQDILLQALNIINLNYSAISWTLDLIGAGTSGAYLQQMITDLKLQSKVNVIGEKNRAWMLNNLCNYHILIQPSRYEGFGLTIIEGFAAGLPVLASDIDGPKEIIDTISSGYLFKNGDIKDCANELVKLLKLYEEGNINDAINQSFEEINTKYSIKVCANKYMLEYSRVMAIGAKISAKSKVF